MTWAATIKRALRRQIGEARWGELRNLYVRGRSRLQSQNLPLLATLWRTDKWNIHWYAQHYQTHFQPRRHKRLNVLEIGVGGYDDPHAGGASLRMWKYYFPNARIYGLDLHDKSNLEETRISIFRGSQIDEDFLRGVVDSIGGVDIIIDDGSHISAHVVRTFELLFPLLADDGIYVVEDTQTSYWPGSGSTDLRDPLTSMNRLKALVDGLNYEEFLDPAYVPSYFDRHIVAVHFYHNLVFIYKGTNAEGSNKSEVLG